MSISQRENLLRHYRHEKAEYYPDVTYLQSVIPTKGIPERPWDKNDPVDWFGVRYNFDATVNAFVPDVTGPHVVSDVTKWQEQVTFPDLDSWDWEWALKVDDIEGKVDRENKVFMLLIQAGIYERLHSLMGMDAALAAFIEEPEALKGLIDAIADWKVKLFGYLIKYYKPDILRQHDDYGSQRNMQMSPALWREMIKPHTARFVALCHDAGVFFEQHSCGMVGAIVGDFCEVGVDSWNGMHINDVPALKKITGDRMNYNMSLSVSDYVIADMAGVLTEQILRKNIRDTFGASIVGGNYFAGNPSALGQPDWWGLPIIKDEMEKIKAENADSYAKA